MRGLLKVVLNACTRWEQQPMAQVIDFTTLADYHRQIRCVEADLAARQAVLVKQPHQLEALRNAQVAVGVLQNLYRSCEQYGLISAKVGNMQQDRLQHLTQEYQTIRDKLQDAVPRYYPRPQLSLVVSHS